MASQDRLVLLVLLIATAIAWRKLGMDEAAPGSEYVTVCANEQRQLACFATGVAATLLASLSPQWRRCRTPALIGLRLLAGALPSQSTASHFPGVPSTFAADSLVRTVFGSGALHLLLFSTVLPLELLPHLLVQTACLAAAMAPSATASICSLPVLSSHLAGQRIGSLHQLIGATVLGILPAEYPACSLACRCAAALNFLLLWLGWLLPTYLAARRHCWLPPSHSAQQGDASLAAPHKGYAREQRVGVGRADRSRSSSVAAWMLNNIFLHNEMLGLEATAWFVLTGLCWLGGTTAALVAG